MTNINIPVKLLENFGDLQLPAYETTSSAGMDLRAAIDEPITLKPMERALIPTGFAFALPSGYEAQIRPRSGLAYKNGVTVLNSPGTIDADYRGEVKALLVNLGTEDFVIERGMRVAQMIIAPFTQGQFKVAANLDDTDRGEGGFGSTGTA